MKVEIVREAKLSKIDHLFVVLAEGVKAEGTGVSELVDGAVKDAGFEGRSDESITILSGTPRKLTLVGIGKKVTVRAVRTAIYAIGKIARKQRDKKIAVSVPLAIPDFDDAFATRLIADALAAADYKYDSYITTKNDEKRAPVDAVLIAASSLDAKTIKRLNNEAHAIIDGVHTVRDLGNAPSNIMTATRIAERAAEVAKETGVKCTIYGKREIERMKMGGLIAVNRGSVEEPRFIILEYTPRKAKKHVALVGKGITFDSGGISIKPAEKMEEMKFDMCGAAAVIGTIETAAKLGLPVKITGAIPSTDNLPSGSAYKPGEIITMMNGKTVEIVNTDAEGRMILGDALHWASQQKPDHMIDYATLTGACVVALASEAAGLFTSDDELARKLIECGERVGERLWRLPEWDDYKDLVRSEWADIKNSGGRWGGAITAAIFLKEFVTCPSWAHLDIAGTAYAEHESPREARGATGAGVRVTIEFLESLSR
ncbi:MAG TPA: leucyl aminopeptidase [Thermoanaerobaculia bacterium]|nr:leucyl aminopeptidase [Thermoanaerobaculia bacterium]